MMDLECLYAATANMPKPFYDDGAGRVIFVGDCRSMPNTAYILFTGNPVPTMSPWNKSFKDSISGSPGQLQARIGGFHHSLIPYRRT